MHIFYFTSDSEGLAGKLRELIEQTAPGSSLTRYSSVEDLAAGLRAARPNGLGVAVLVCASRAELRKLLGIASLLADLNRIVILPDRAAATVAQGLKLLPNFFSYQDANPVDIGLVFEKILQRTTEPRLAGSDRP